jgi:CheY-like chemotaxis protein
MMSESQNKPKRILFVDDNKPFLDVIQQVLLRRDHHTYEVLVAETAGEALSILRHQGIDMVVIDIQMPVMDGMQFLSLVHRQYPSLKKVVLTGLASENYRAASLSGGAELFLEKPRSVEGMETILTTLKELLRWQPEEGFRGVLRRVGLQDVIQLECLSRHSLILEIMAAEVTGEIYIRDGSIIHARLGQQTGEGAFYQLLSLPSGEFNFKSFAEPPAITIEGSWEFLLMEAARVRDEASQMAAINPPLETGAEPTLISSEAAGVNAAANASSLAAPLESTQRLAEPATIPKVPVPVPQSASQAMAAKAQETPTLATRIEEIMICSARGEVLYEWQCVDTNERLNFLEFISQRAHQLAQGLPLGTFERVEMQVFKGRLVVLIKDDYGLLIRSNRICEWTGETG